MSFARPRLALGLSPRIPARQRSTALSSSILAYRNIHSSRCSHASPLETPGRLEGPVSIKSPPLGAGSFTAKDEPGKDIDPYRDGPSAIDKAVHLFFFTEIIRGARFGDNYFKLLHESLRNVDRSGEFLQAALHNHVPV
jgi:NADH dehydrogenase (ubiquinone) Fe-S protein 8